MFNFVLLSQMRWFQLNSRIVRTHFASVMTLNNCEIIAETRSYIFRLRSRCRRRRVYLRPRITLNVSHILLSSTTFTFFSFFIKRFRTYVLFVGSDLLKLSDCQLYLVFTAPKIKNNIHCCEPVTSTVLFKLQDNYLGVVFSVIEQK